MSAYSDPMMSYGEDFCHANRNTEADSSESSENFDELGGRYSTVETTIQTCEHIHSKQFGAK